MSVQTQERIAHLLEKVTGLRPLPSGWTGWANGTIGCYQAAKGDFDAIERGFRAAWAREQQYRPTTLACRLTQAGENGFVKAVMRECATSGNNGGAPAPYSDEWYKAQMEADPQYQAFRGSNE